MLLLRALWHLLAYTWCELLRRQYHPAAEQYAFYSLRALRHQAQVERFLRGHSSRRESA
jgi:hypothetical protein